jgi:hypothetical protein
MGQYVWLMQLAACITWAGGCGFPRPADVGDDGGLSSSICAANQALRCDGSNLVRCNGDGTAEVNETCLLGCSATGLRCNDLAPSNGLAPYLDMTTSEPDLDLGTTATINTDDGTVMVDGKSVIVDSMVMAQGSAPAIRVFIGRSLTATDVTITGSNAFAVVSDGDLQIGGIFAASANGFTVRGPGAFNDGTCQGGQGAIVNGGAIGGAGGGGFGFAGGKGGSATNDSGIATGGAGGTATGNPTLVPLRGGCDSGKVGASLFGFGGGAMQLVSRTKITVGGVVAANGSSGSGGGSGGGILLEAPVVEVSGSLVANGGGGGGGCIFPKAGEDGRLDATPATGGDPCDTDGVKGGNGGAGNSGAGNGGSINQAGTGNAFAFAGYGGGGVGRIRVNTLSGGFHRTGGLFSPNPSTGAIATR